MRTHLLRPALLIAALMAFVPLRVAADSSVTITNDGPHQVTVAVGTIIAVDLRGRMSLGQPHPYQVPESSNSAVVVKLSGATDSQARTQATYRALTPGAARLSGSGPSGIMCPDGYTTPGPGCIAVAAILFTVDVTVVSATPLPSAPPTKAPQPPPTPAPADTGAASAHQWVLVGAAVGAIAAMLGAVAAIVRAGRSE